MLETKEVSVDALSGRGGGDVGYVGFDGVTEEPGDGGRVGRGVFDGVAECDGFVRDTTACRNLVCAWKEREERGVHTSFGPSLLESPRSSRLIRRPILSIHLEIRQLDDHLHIRIRRAPELLD